MKVTQKYLAICIAAITMLLAMGCTRIGPGHAGIVINQAGSDRGVLNQTAATGWVFYNPISESVIEYQTSMRGEKWTRDTSEGKAINEEITFTNQDQMLIAADIGISYSLDSTKLPAFYVKFLAKNEDDLDTKFTNGYLRNAVRNCLNDNAGKYAIAQIMGDNAQFLRDSKKCVQDDVAQYGVNIDQFGLLGAPRPPQNVINSINSKSETEQKTAQSNLEIQQVEAEAKKRKAEADGEASAIRAVAEAQADANKKLAASLSPALVQYEAVKRWDGHRPTVEGNSSGLLLNVK